MTKSNPFSFLLAATMMAAAAHAQGASPIKVNGTTIPQQRVEFFVKNLIAQGRPDTPELREAVKNELIDRELLVQEAARRGLPKNAEIANELEFARQAILIRSLVQEAARGTPINDETTRKEYERIKSQLGTREYKARHILLANEDEAKDVIAQVKKGGSFEKLASEKSRDPGSKAKGGELDWAGSDGYVKPFGDALAKLKKGQMTDTPVQSQFGWHVIRLDDERPRKVPAYEDVKTNIQQQMQQQSQKQALDKLLADLRAKAKLE